MKKVLLGLFFASTLAGIAQAQSFSCGATGAPQSSYRVSKGKFGGYKAKIVGNKIVVNVAGRKLVINSGGKVTLNGRGAGRIKCKPSRARAVISG